MIRPTAAPQPSRRRGVVKRFVEEVVASDQPGVWFEWGDPVTPGVMTRSAVQFAAEHRVDVMVERCPIEPGAAETEHRLKGRLLPKVPG